MLIAQPVSIDRYEILARPMNQAGLYSDTSSATEQPLFYITPFYKLASTSITQDRYAEIILDLGELKKQGISIYDESSIQSYLQQEQLDPKILLSGAAIIQENLPIKTAFSLKLIQLSEDEKPSLFFEIKAKMNTVEAKRFRHTVNEEWIKKAVASNATKINFHLRTLSV